MDMPDVPFRPTTPPAQPAPSVPQPTPAVPVSPPPAPPTPTPPPVVPPVPPSPPPTTPPAPPTPSAPIPKNPHPHHILTGLFVLLCALGVIGILILVFYPTLQRMIPQSTPPTVSTVLPPVATTTQTPGSAATSTAEATSTAPAYQEPAPTIHRLGETVRLFSTDSAVYKNNSGTLFSIQVKQFTDSRCAKGNTCIWAGERGVILTVTNMTTNETATVTLGMVRARSAAAFGLTFTLKEGDDEKGGTYADISVR